MNTELATKEDRIASRIDTSISANTGLNQGGSMNFTSIEQIMNFAKIMAIAGVAIPKHLRENVGACLAVAIQSSEWQMSPFAVARKTYVVNDQISFEAQLVNAVILRRAPIKDRFEISYSGEGQTRKCKVSVTLLSGKSVEYESPAFSAIPIKNSPLWKGDPDQQLFYYSSRAMCRRHFPDVLLGIYTPDELEDSADTLDVPMKVVAQTSPKFVPAIVDKAKKTAPIDDSGTKTPTPFATDAQAVQILMTESGIGWPALSRYIKEQGWGAFEEFEQVDTETMADVLKNFPSIAEALK